MFVPSTWEQILATAKGGDDKGITISDTPSLDLDLKQAVLAELRDAVACYRKEHQRWRVACLKTDAAEDAGLPMTTVRELENWDNIACSAALDAERRLMSVMLLICGRIDDLRDVQSIPLREGRRPFTPCVVVLAGVCYAVGPQENDSTRPMLHVFDHENDTVMCD